MNCNQSVHGRSNSIFWDPGCYLAWVPTVEIVSPRNQWFTQLIQSLESKLILHLTIPIYFGVIPLISRREISEPCTDCEHVIDFPHPQTADRWKKWKYIVNFAVHVYSLMKSEHLKAKHNTRMWSDHVITNLFWSDDITVA